MHRGVSDAESRGGMTLAVCRVAICDGTFAAQPVAGPAQPMASRGHLQSAIGHFEPSLEAGGEAQLGLGSAPQHIHSPTHQPSAIASIRLRWAVGRSAAGAGRRTAALRRRVLTQRLGQKAFSCAEQQGGASVQA